MKTSLIILILFIEMSLLHVTSKFECNAQNFERFSNKDGFNQNTINAIAQDKYGFLWFGTPKGLIKYDGYDFETYTKQSKTKGSISNNNINSLNNDEKGAFDVS